MLVGQRRSLARTLLEYFRCRLEDRREIERREVGLNPCCACLGGHQPLARVEGEERTSLCHRSSQQPRDGLAERLAVRTALEKLREQLHKHGRDRLVIAG